jgi:hypothetical protein
MEKDLVIKQSQAENEDQSQEESRSQRSLIDVDDIKISMVDIK